MDTLRELVNKIYNDLQDSDRLNQYPDLAEKDIVSEIIQTMALKMMPKFIEKSKLEEFVEESEKNYKEGTFKKYISDYTEFLGAVEQEFYNGLLMGLVEE